MWLTKPVSACARLVSDLLELHAGELVSTQLAEVRQQPGGNAQLLAGSERLLGEKDLLNELVAIDLWVLEGVIHALDEQVLRALLRTEHTRPLLAWFEMVAYMMVAHNH